MKVLQTIAGLNASSGGPSTCTCDLMNGLQDIGASVELLTMACNNPDDKVLGEGSRWLHTVPYDCRKPLFWSKNLDEAMRKSDYDLYHCNAIWMGVNHSTCKIAREKGKPYVLSTHGMLYPTALKIHYWKKWPLLKLWYNEDIHSAACIHATCQQEADYLRQFGFKGPIAIIPNPVVFPKGVEFKDESLKLRDNLGRRQIGFLGRLHPIKKVEQVLYALDYLKRTENNLKLSETISFQIMGKFDALYEKWLKDEVVRLHLEDCVEFVGFVSGKDKYNRLSKLSALMVPSAQENFGMIVPEALICGTPVYASLGTPWSELNACNCGWWDDNSPETIAKVITDLISKSDAELRAMGANGRKLMEEKYEQHKVAQMMLELYKWIVEEKMDKTKLPQFVIL